jgi:ATP-dependent helicase/DNAse subunit B
MSRFIQQMRVELQVENPQSVLVPVQMTPSQPITIEKTEAVQASLSRYFKNEVAKEESKRFSASALNMYLDCRLRFYLRYVAELKEKEEVVTEIDPMTFGTLLHRAIELLYAIEEGKDHRDIDSHGIDRLRPQIPAAVDVAIREFYRKEEGDVFELSGQLQIAREVFIKYLEAILSYDQKNGDFRVIGLEKPYEAGLVIETSVGKKEVALGGVIDRMDCKDGVIRLLDYKTGKDTKSLASIASLFDREDKKRNKAAMQTMLYAFFYQFNHPTNTLPLKPGIFTIKEIYSEDFNPFLQLDKSELSDYRDHAEDFEEGLRGLLEELVDPAVPFDQTSDKKKCSYCAYKSLCGR